MPPARNAAGRLDTGGAAAEYVTAAADTVVAAPTAVPLAHAAAIPIAGVTAWQAVFEQAGIASGQRVLVNGAGGGVGGFAVQLAKYAGAHVIATASPRSTDVVRQLGADQIVDYTAAPLADALDGPVDAILNFVVVSARHAAMLMSLVRPGGVVVSATAAVKAPAGSPATAVHFVARNDTGHLAALVKLVDAGAVRVDVAASRPLTDLASVHRKVHNRVEAAGGRVAPHRAAVPQRYPQGSAVRVPAKARPRASHLASLNRAPGRSTRSSVTRIPTGDTHADALRRPSEVEHRAWRSRVLARAPLALSRARTPHHRRCGRRTLDDQTTGHRRRPRHPGRPGQRSLPDVQSYVATYPKGESPGLLFALAADTG